MTEENTGQIARRIVLQSLESLQRAGVGQLPRSKRKSATPIAAATTAPNPSTIDAAHVETRPAVVSNQSAIRDPHCAIDSAAALAVIRREVAGCARCPELASTRKQTVFGVGDPHARLCFMGEAPGADEDQQGEPFVGKAGQLLDKIIEACTLRREQVYILNTIKCRPPGNRPPEPDEKTNCRGFLDRQLDLIRPEYICCLGATAAQALLNSDESIGRLRGKFFEYRGSRVLCTYHPAYLLRNPAAKRDVWSDMRLLLREMGIPLPPRGAD
ncbi:MAG TPA: uracil-DNA glycosylase [Pirellulales bacterium]|nr:uracil-DNA glycosylase [Pirellulales bacterium]